MILVYIFDENQKLVKSKDVKISVSLFAEQWRLKKFSSNQKMFKPECQFIQTVKKIVV